MLVNSRNVIPIVARKQEAYDSTNQEANDEQHENRAIVHGLLQAVIGRQGEAVLISARVHASPVPPTPIVRRPTAEHQSLRRQPLRAARRPPGISRPQLQPECSRWRLRVMCDLCDCVPPGFCNVELDATSREYVKGVQPAGPALHSTRDPLGPAFPQLP